MNSDDSKNKPKLSAFEKGAGGVIGCFIARAFLQPLDVLKIRFQLQVESTKKNRGGLYYGVFQATKTIYKQEGTKALWKGHVPAQALSITYGAGQFWTYSFLEKHARDSGFAAGGIDFLCGGAAGTVGTLISMPFDIARTRIVAQSFPEYSGMLDVWSKIVKREGVTRLWRGLTPTLAMTAPFTAVQFHMYHSLLTLMEDVRVEERRVMSAKISVSGICGAAAGAVAKAAVYPLDVLKKRVQIRGSESVRRHFGKVVVYGSIWDCIRRVTVEEGVLAWFKGLKPSLVKNAAYSGLVFAIYEAFSDLLRAVKSEGEEG